MRLGPVVLIGLALAAAGGCDRLKAGGGSGAAAGSASVPELEAAVPHVALSASAVTLDGEPAGSVPTAGTVVPVPELLTKLRVRRATALSEGNDAPTDPRATLEVSDDTSGHALKVLLETASRGNYPSIVVVSGRGTAGQWSRTLGYDVPTMPRPRDREDGLPPLPTRLFVTVREATFTLEARAGTAPVVAERSVPRRVADVATGFPALVVTAREVLAAMPKPAPGQGREAVLFVPDAMRLGALHPVLDALAGLEPGLSLRVHRAEAPPPAEGPRKGAMVVVKGITVPDGQPPERLFYALRSEMSKLRACYEVAHAERRSLRGTVVVRFTVAPTGEIVEPKVDAAKSTARDAGLEACLAGALVTIPVAKASVPVDATCTLELDYAE